MSDSQDLPHRAEAEVLAEVPDDLDPDRAVLSGEFGEPPTDGVEEQHDLLRQEQDARADRGDVDTDYLVDPPHEEALDTWGGAPSGPTGSETRAPE
jgi:hypothetical protein